MEFLIKEIIKRLEEINAKGGEGNNRQSVALDPDKHNKEESKIGRASCRERV